MVSSNSGTPEILARYSLVENVSDTYSSFAPPINDNYSQT